MTTPIKIPSINQSGNAIKNIKQQCSYDGVDEAGNTKYKVLTYPALKFYGTNASVL